MSSLKTLIAGDRWWGGRNQVSNPRKVQAFQLAGRVRNNRGRNGGPNDRCHNLTGSWCLDLGTTTVRIRRWMLGLGLGLGF